MKELWTGINTVKGETIYTIRFTTDSKKEYEAIQEIGRKVLDSQEYRIAEKLERLQEICRK